LRQRNDVSGPACYRRFVKESSMDINTHSTVADVATNLPATIRVFQQNGIDFCCGGKRPIAEACADRGLDADVVVGALRASVAGGGPERNWTEAPLAELIAHIQARFHEPLRKELPRLQAMLAKVVDRHGDRHPEVLPALQETFAGLQRELLDHMRKEDAILFPAIVGLEADGGTIIRIDAPIHVMETEHEDAGRALARMRELTRGYTPPPEACPTFRGLYYGLAELERDMHLHVHLENNVLFPRASALAHST